MNFDSELFFTQNISDNAGFLIRSDGIDEDDQSEPFFEGDSDVAVEEAVKIDEPPLYQVILLNDDYTPMDFVVGLLQSLFSMDLQQATYVMLEVHTKGRGICGQYTFEIAETKVAQARQMAAEHNHPLLCTMEPVPLETI